MCLELFGGRGVKLSGPGQVTVRVAWGPGQVSTRVAWGHWGWGPTAPSGVGSSYPTHLANELWGAFPWGTAEPRRGCLKPKFSSEQM